MEGSHSVPGQTGGVQCAVSPGCRFGRLLAGLDVTPALGRRMTRSQLAQKLTSVHIPPAEVRGVAWQFEA